MPKVNNLFYVTRTDPQTGEMVSAQDKRKVFVSYKRDDSRLNDVCGIVVRKILQMVDCAVWYDDGLTPGVDFKDEIIEAISKCDALVLVLSKNILQSDFVWDVEVTTAFEQKKGIIPIAFDISRRDYEIVAKRLGDIQMLKWPSEGSQKEVGEFESSFKRAVERFVINSDLNLKTKQFFLSGAHRTPIAYLNIEERFLMGYGYLNGIGVDADGEKGVSLVNSVVKGYGSDETTNAIKNEAARSLDSYYCERGMAEKALAYTVFGATNGSVEAMELLAQKYLLGMGIRPSCEKALEWYEKAAMCGSESAAYTLGCCYCDGSIGFSESIEQDYQKAENWLTKAAELGSAAAMTKLGIMYQDGVGVKRDLEKAAEWYVRAADCGYSKAMNNLGVLYSSADNPDSSKVLEWYHRAAEMGSVKAMYNLGRVYAKGRIVEKDQVKAEGWFVKAAEGGGAEMMCELASMYLFGDGVPRNNARAVKWFAKAANLGNEFALGMLRDVMDDFRQAHDEDRAKYFEICFERAKLMDEDAIFSVAQAYYSGDGVEKNKAKAAEYFAMGARLGCVDSKLCLGLMYYYGDGVDQNNDEAETLLTEAADAGEVEAMILLGRMYFDGEHEKTDKERAVEWWRKAADSGSTEALCYLGYLYENGDGVEKDQEKAIELYERAAEKGCLKAEQAMRLLKRERNSEKANHGNRVISDNAARRIKKAAQAAAKAEKQRLRAERKAARRSGK